MRAGVVLRCRKLAFVIVATKGKSFCGAAVEAIGLIASNAGQIAVVESISSMMFIIGKICIVCVSGLAGFAWLERDPAYQEGTCGLQSTLGVLLLAVIAPSAPTHRGSAALMRFFHVRAGGSKELSSQLIPLALLVILSYAVATAFLSVYSLAIDTILVCFCEDMAHHTGQPVRLSTS